MIIMLINYNNKTIKTMNRFHQSISIFTVTITSLTEGVHFRFDGPFSNVSFIFFSRKRFKIKRKKERKDDLSRYY